MGRGRKTKTKKQPQQNNRRTPEVEPVSEHLNDVESVSQHSNDNVSSEVMQFTKAIHTDVTKCVENVAPTLMESLGRLRNLTDKLLFGDAETYARLNIHRQLTPHEINGILGSVEKLLVRMDRVINLVRASLPANFVMPTDEEMEQRREQFRNRPSTSNSSNNDRDMIQSIMDNMNLHALFGRR
jgi:hypothetical protein